MISNLSNPQRLLVFENLMRGFKAAKKAPLDIRWAWLESAHVVGQQQIRLHLESHLSMLKLALQTADIKEAVGQLLRLALVPLGHLSGRLPAGNPGRATVSAFAAMPVEIRLQYLIEQAAAEAITTSD